MGTSHLMVSKVPMVAARGKGETVMDSKAPTVARVDKVVAVVAVAMDDGVKVQITGF